MQSPTFFNYKCYWIAKIKGDDLTITRVVSMPALATPSDHQGFDYNTLDATTSQFIQQQTGEIRALMKRTAQDIIEVGQKLTKVKKQLGHGRFGDWLHAEFQWSISAATRFMQVSERFQFINLANLDVAPSALYELAAPSTPEAARDEAVTRAKTGESITYKAAKSIKQKYATPPKPKLEPILQSLPTPPSLASLPQSGSKLEIVAFRPQIQTPTIPQPDGVIANQAGVAASGSQVDKTGSNPDVPGVWWQLGGRHLLYCGDPNSPEFVGQVTERVSLLLAFPPVSDWQTVIRAKARIIVDEYLPEGKNMDQLDENLESIVLFYTYLHELVVSCFLPSPEILSIINRHSRRGLFAEPDSKRVAAVISDWKKAGLKAEQVN